ncbi:hypothetical protein F0562_001123 [Nyssa sinensis]|uniref:Uncharacterized protein n=1 Tax=Nyssa sinensis TaxID=561372 RepID=A0A5J5C3M5_9ASTE|nr:hypothetical protein F0562_001123 [Nyssa sinensis]
MIGSGFRIEEAHEESVDGAVGAAKGVDAKVVGEAKFNTTINDDFDHHRQFCFAISNGATDCFLLFRWWIFIISGSYAIFEPTATLQSIAGQSWWPIWRDKIIEPLYRSDQSLIQPNRSTGSWNRSLLISNTANPTISNPSLWNSSATHTTGTFLNPNQWPNLTSYGPPT